MILIYNTYLVENDGDGFLYYRYPDRLGKMMLSQPQMLAYKQFIGEDIISHIIDADVRKQVITALEDFNKQ